MMKENVLQIKEEPPVEGLMTFDERHQPLARDLMHDFNAAFRNFYCRFFFRMPSVSSSRLLVV